MNLVRLHYADGSVESFRPSGYRSSRIFARRGLAGLPGSGRPVARTDAGGRVVGQAIAPPLLLFPRWSQSVLDGERFARNLARVRAETREEIASYQPTFDKWAEIEERLEGELEERFESKPSAAWPVLAALLVLAVLAGSIASSVG